MAKPPTSHPSRVMFSLVGKFFHARNLEGSVSWQGRILAEPSPGVFYVELYEWLMGEPDTRTLVRLDDMLSLYPNGRPVTRFEFYDTAEQMTDKWNRVLQSKKAGKAADG
jgi:hypothetical protein